MDIIEARTTSLYPPSWMHVLGSTLLKLGTLVLASLISVCALVSGRYGSRNSVSVGLLVRRSTSAAPTTSSSTTPSLEFEHLPILKTCDAATIRWTYSGPRYPLSLSIRSIQNQDGDNGGPDDVDQLISGDVDPTSLRFVWQEVDVPDDIYDIIASMNAFRDFKAQTSFIVSNESDGSCVSTTSGNFQIATSTSSWSTSGSSTIAYGLTSPPSGASTSGTLQDATLTSGSAPSSSTIAHRITSPPSGTSTSGLTPGAIAGTIIGCLVGVGMIITICVLYIRRRRVRAAIRSSSFSPTPFTNHRSDTLPRVTLNGTVNQTKYSREGPASVERTGMAGILSSREVELSRLIQQVEQQGSSRVEELQRRIDALREDIGMLRVSQAPPAYDLSQ